MATIDIAAPLVASVFEILVAKGDAVAVEQELIILESMKMEIPVVTEHAGVVTEVLVEKSASVAEGDILVRIELG